jgi:DNA-binding response OmpR family regulator
MKAGAILILEDDPDLRTALIDLLSDEHERVLSAPNGAVGLRLVEREVPAVIITDLRMPVMNGWDFVHDLFAREALRGVPVLVFSGEGVAPADALPKAVSVFRKPGDLERLVATVRAIVARPRPQISGLARIPSSAPCAAAPRAASTVAPAATKVHNVPGQGGVKQTLPAEMS